MFHVGLPTCIMAVFGLGVSLKKGAENLRKTSTRSTAEFYFAMVPHFATSFFLEGVEG